MSIKINYNDDFLERLSEEDREIVNQIILKISEGASIEVLKQAFNKSNLLSVLTASNKIFILKD